MPFNSFPAALTYPHLQREGFSDRLYGWIDPTKNLVDELLESYANCGGIKHLNGATLPSKMAVAGLTEDLLHIIFPGFIAEQQVSCATCRMKRRCN